MKKTCFKILLVGAPNTGKTNFQNKWTKDSFSETIDPIKEKIGTNMGFKAWENEGTTYRIQIWSVIRIQDTEHLEGEMKMITKGTNGLVAISDGTNISTRKE